MVMQRTIGLLAAVVAFAGTAGCHPRGRVAQAPPVAIGYYGAASSGDGQGYELNVIAAAVVGGASLSGGKGRALGWVSSSGK